MKTFRVRTDNGSFEGRPISATFSNGAPLITFELTAPARIGLPGGLVMAYPTDTFITIEVEKIASMERTDVE